MHRDSEKVVYKGDGFTYRVVKREYGGGEFTRFVIVTFPPYRFDFLSPSFDFKVLYEIYDLSVNYVMRRTKTDISPVFLSPHMGDYPSYLIEETPFGTHIQDKFSALINTLSQMANEGKISVEEGRFASEISEVSAFLNEGLDTYHIFFGYEGGKPFKFMGIYPSMGFINPLDSRGKIVMNSHFFLMEPTDINTPFSLLGEPVGGLIVDGSVKFPYLYERSALFLYRNHTSEVKKVGIRDMEVVIGERSYIHGKNAVFYVRPEYEVSPAQKGTDIVIVNNRIVGRKKGGGTEVPDAGFVLHTEEDIDISGHRVVYRVKSIENIVFSVQGGPWLVKDERPASFFDDPFYKDEPIYFPPTVFPVAWGARYASRSAIGTTKNGELLILHVEGTNESTYIPGLDSRGFTLSELSEVMYSYGAKDGINLDGGGSAQLYLEGGKFFTFADRRGMPGLSYRRPVPLGLTFYLRDNLVI